MFSPRSFSLLFALLAVAVLTSLLPAQTNASTAFTHQGELRSNDVPVDGPRDLRFRLYDAPTAGNQVGAQLVALAVPVTQGRFTVLLDFGAAAFNGQSRWLEVDVGDGPTFVTLSPRQAITATPYAAYALSANSDIQCSTDTSFSIDDRSGWVHVEAMSDDSCFSSLPLGFTFTGWGRSDTTVSLSSNGVLFFGNTCNTQFNNTPLPSAMSTSPFLAFFWDDLFDNGSSEYFEYTTMGTAGGRVFYMFFRNRLFDANACSTNDINLMISIHEGSNLISVTYSAFNGCAGLRGSSATFGLQGPGGAAAKAFMVGCDVPILDDNASRQSINFTPPKR